MKKLILSVLAALICLCAVSCGSDSKYEKYDTLINYLENGNYDLAEDFIENLRENETAKPGEPEVYSVEITNDNWQDYFEIVQKKMTNTNDFGETTDVYLSHYLVLKDSYKIHDMGGENKTTRIATEYNCVAEWRYVEIDLAAAEITVGDLVPDREVKDITGQTLTVMGAETPLSGSRSYSEGMQEIKSGYEIVRMQGTLWLEK